MADPYANIRRALEMGPTPGPWSINTAGIGVVNGEIVNEIYVYNPAVADDVAIATDIVDPETGEPSEANAALIAASDPDTIRALLVERDALAAALEEAQMGLRYVMRVWVLADEIEWSEAEIDEAVERTIGDAKKEAGRG